MPRIPQNDRLFGDDSRIAEQDAGLGEGSTLGSELDEPSSHTEPDPSEDEILGELLFQEIRESEKQNKHLNAEQPQVELHGRAGAINSRGHTTDQSVEVGRSEFSGLGDLSE